MKEICPEIFQIKVPLPGNILKELNSYLVLNRTGGRNLLIDTGFNHDDSHKAVLKALAELGTGLDETDIFLTHLHADHSGLAHRLLTGRNRIFCSRQDGDRLNENTEGAFLEIVALTTNLYGLPADKSLLRDGHWDKRPTADGGSYHGRIDYNHLAEGDELDLGRYNLRVLELPGHTPGHLGLYEAERNFMFCGDHVLNSISPNIVVWEDRRDYLGIFMDSLRKVADLKVGRLFPGHRDLIYDPPARIEELLAHHGRRLEEVLNYLKDGQGRTVYEIAQHISWDLAHSDVTKFSREQLWFATSETYAHVMHLFFKGLVKREDRGQTAYFRGM